MIVNDASELTNKLATCTYTCTGKSFQSDPLVLIHGWGSDSKTWSLILPELRKHLNIITIDLPGFGCSEFYKKDISSIKQSILVNYFIDAILKVIPANCSLMGWSLGGAIATAMIGQYPSRFSNLITIATNPCFVKKDDWDFGMPSSIFNKFLKLFQGDPSVCLKKFHHLQRSGDLKEKKLSKFLQPSEIKKIALFANSTKKNHRHIYWLRALKLLQEIDNRNVLKSLESPGLHFFGENDQLVNHRVAHEIILSNPAHKIRVFEQRCHLIHISNAKEIASSTIKFIKENRYSLNKKKIANSFSNAASTYESVSRLQSQTGKKLLTMMPNQITPNTIIDLGCGTGCFVKSIQNKNSYSKIIGLDLAEGMLKMAKSQHDYTGVWLCGDAENIPLANNSVDIIFSNLTFQWCSQTATLAKEIARILKPGGKLLFTTLGENTLYELKTSWMKVDSYVHVNKFLDTDIWKKAFINEGIQFEDFQVCDYILKYGDLSDLMYELKKLGAHNLNSGQKKTMTNKKNIRNLINAYDQYRDPKGNLPATWQVIFGVGVLGA